MPECEGGGWYIPRQQAEHVSVAVNDYEALRASLKEMLDCYWGDGDGQHPAPEFIQRAQALVADHSVSEDRS